MLGFAQRLFTEQGQTFPHAKNVKPAAWDTLEKCFNVKLLASVDFWLAKTLLKNQLESNEGLAALVCHLSLSARQGHLCVSIKDSVIDPDPRISWLNDTENATELLEEFPRLLENVYKLILEGTCKSNLCEFIKQFHHLYYLQKFWVYEEIFLHALKGLLLEPPKYKLEVKLIEEAIKRLTNDGALLPLQGKAIASACLNRLTILSGGPGTGKTYTAGKMIGLLWENLEASVKEKFKIALAAPTGKAAANLQASLWKSTQNIKDFPSIKACTLHSLLGIKNKNSMVDLEKKLNADLIIVDESSMIDVRMMAALFCSIKPAGRLILLGDRFQLPSVEAGSLFACLIELFEKLESPSLVELTQCVRTDKADLIQFANAVKAGDVSAARSILHTAHANGSIIRLPYRDEDTHKIIIDYARPYFEKIAHKDPLAILQHFNRFRILTPLRKGPWGVEEINKKMHISLKSAVVPIMLMQNDQRLDLYNGETGILVRDLHEEYALFSSRTSEKEFRRFPAAILPKYEYAYCLSVHKSQGSEFDHVLMIVPKGAEIFGREIFYTAATRARQQLFIWGADNIIEETLRHQSHRLSGIGLKFPQREIEIPEFASL